MNYDVNSLN